MSISRSILSATRIFPRLSRLSSTAHVIQRHQSQDVAPAGGSLVISDSAVSRLKDIAGDQGWLRVAVEGGGCSGFQYKLDLEEEGAGAEVGEDDVIVEKDGARVVVDQTSLEYLQVDLQSKYYTQRVFTYMFDHRGQQWTITWSLSELDSESLQILKLKEAVVVEQVLISNLNCRCL